MKKRALTALAVNAIVLVATQTWGAECFVGTFLFPPEREVRCPACGPDGVCGTAFHTASGEKAVSGTKLSGFGTTFVNGVQSNNTAITGCGVQVNDPADGTKEDTTGCVNAAKWRIRIFN